jgi:hypothetical protein
LRPRRPLARLLAALPDSLLLALLAFLEWVARRGRDRRDHLSCAWPQGWGGWARTAHGALLCCALLALVGSTLGHAELRMLLYAAMTWHFARRTLDANPVGLRLGTAWRMRRLRKGSWSGYLPEAGSSLATDPQEEG